MSTTPLLFEQFVKSKSFTSDGETLAVYELRTAFFLLSIAEHAHDPPDYPGLTYLAQVNVISFKKGVPVDLYESFEEHFSIVDNKFEAVRQINTFLTKLYGDLGRVLGEL